MAGLEYLSSVGLGVLLKTQKRLRQAAAGDLRVVNAGKHIRDIFRYAGLLQIFHMEGSA
jgi:anti-anti-sigma factor